MDSTTRLGQTPEPKDITLDSSGKLVVPPGPRLGVIPGDGIGPDLWNATRLVLEAAVAKAYGDARKLYWEELLAGEAAMDQTGQPLPEETLEGITRLKVALKGPLTTPVGGGFRSVNVGLRQKLDLYACVRPVRWIPGTPSPLKKPQDVDMVVFRENTEDVYAGVEWPAGSPEAGKVVDFLNQELGTELSLLSAIGIKPITERASKRLIRMAIKYALAHGRQSVTLVHKGNIMKYTEGAFKDWGYELAREEFAGQTAPEGQAKDGQVEIKDRIADNMFQQALLRPAEYQVLATPNLNGDYISDALAAMVGGLGMAPGANIGDKAAVFEATHGSAPKYAGQDKVNPGSLILSGAMMLEHLGWAEGASLIAPALSRTISDKVVTYDLARQLEGASEVSCSGFARAVAERL